MRWRVISGQRSSTAKTTATSKRRRGIATQLNTMTRNPMAAKGLLQHSSANTTLIHYIKEVPEATANGMAQVEQLFGELDSDEQAVQ